MDPKYKVASAIARKRRDDLLAASYPLPDFEESRLPQDLRACIKEPGIFTRAELTIIKSDAETILGNIRRRVWSSVEVTKAFCKASAIAQKLTNCVTEVLFKEALDRAQYLDDYLKATGSVIGPLHGIPLSLKDNFMIAPHPTSNGMAAYANLPTDQDSELVTLLRKLGAVLYVKTNVPTAMMIAETINNVWGETRNPLHKGLSPGGSSGGEAALLAIHGSPLGVGTDIGGSIRIPSASCHLYGLKPSTGRFSVLGARPSIPGQDFINAICGPMSPSLRSVQLFCEAVCSEQAAPWNIDPKVVPIPWRKNVIQPKGRKLRFGIATNGDGVVTCHPPVQRALAMTAKSLRDAGHEVFEWKPIGHPEIVKLVSTAFHEFGSDAIMPLLEDHDEPVFNAMKRVFESGRDTGRRLGPAKLRELILQRNGLQKKYLDRWMDTGNAVDGPMDGIIWPVLPTAANRLQFCEEVQYVGYTGFANILELPSCTFPVTYADKALDLKRGSNWEPLNEMDEQIQKEYDPELYHRAPVSLQLVGKRLEEEKVLEMVEVVADTLGFHRTGDSQVARSRL